MPQPHGPARRVEKRALDGVSFVAGEGEVLGIIGANGAGKSTLLKILSRITAPTAGRATVYGRVASLLEVGTGMHPDMTGRENVYLNGALLGLSRADVTARLPEILEFAGVGDYLDTAIKRYSSGMRLRLAFAVGAHLAAEVMIVDEVLAVGDAAFQDRCLGAMRDGTRSGRTTLFVSHNMPAVENLCDRVLWLDGGKARRMGPASEVVREYLSHAIAGASLAREFGTAEGDTPAGARFLRAAVSNPAGELPLQGDDLLVDAVLAVSAPVRGLKVMIRFTTQEGYPVCALSSLDFRQEWDLAPGTYRLQAHFSSVRLLPRTHKISLYAFTDWGHAGGLLDEQLDALAFTLQERDVLASGRPLRADRGVTWFPAEFRLEPEGSPP
ncbi:MAG TPA: polysaccharide ABC transporter ATP-binding protein [Thermoanaerobaculia bacterium]|nr:polysaccharide ABC transporter ATP-binding protein [Thermoanaerobaculia bacterium]